MTQAVVKECHNLVLQIPVEIHQHIPADDELKLVEGFIGCQVMWRENNILR
jgi:hypothetical protein